MSSTNGRGFQYEAKDEKLQEFRRHLQCADSASEKHKYFDWSEIVSIRQPQILVIKPRVAAAYGDGYWYLMKPNGDFSATRNLRYNFRARITSIGYINCGEIRGYIYVNERCFPVYAHATDPWHAEFCLRWCVFRIKKLLNGDEENLLKNDDDETANRPTFVLKIFINFQRMGGGDAKKCEAKQRQWLEVIASINYNRIRSSISLHDESFNGGLRWPVFNP